MSGWIKGPNGKKWHQVRDYSSYYVVYSLCGVRWHPFDKRVFIGQQNAFPGTSKYTCRACMLQETMLELGE